MMIDELEHSMLIIAHYISYVCTHLVNLEEDGFATHFIESSKCLKSYVIVT
jgi:hypothetical protein